MRARDTRNIACLKPYSGLKCVSETIQLDGDQVLNIDVNGQRWQHHVARGSRSSAPMPIRCAAGGKLDLRIRAERSFVPVRLGNSGDDRELVWRLLDVTLLH